MTKHNFTNMTSEDLINDINGGEALPAIEILKRSIMEAFIIVIRCESDLMKNKRKNYGVVNPSYVEDFSRSLVFLFSLIKGMIRSKGIYNRWSNLTPNSSVPKGSDFELLESLEYGKSLSIKQLVDLKNYLAYCLHKLRLTNLLITNDINIERELEDEY